jgi:hypothetical protein
MLMILIALALTLRRQAGTNDASTKGSALLARLVF